MAKLLLSVRDDADAISRMKIALGDTRIRSLLAPKLALGENGIMKWSLPNMLRYAAFLVRLKFLLRRVRPGDAIFLGHIGEWLEVPGIALRVLDLHIPPAETGVRTIAYTEAPDRNGIELPCRGYIWLSSFLRPGRFELAMEV